MNDQALTSEKTTFTYLILAGIILLQAFVCVHYGVFKKGFFVDELWGAGLANSYFRPRLFTPDVFNTNKYLPSSFFRDYLTVSPDEGFSIASVWYNQSQDSHPPLYFLIYHALSCLEPGMFSKWTGIAINLFFLICTNFCIFLTGEKITGYSETGLAAAALWGFSAEAVSYTVCARMYMMSAFFVILFVFRSLIFYELDKRPGWKDCVFLLLATVGGCLTHYYFYVAAFVMAVLTCIYLYSKNGFRKAYKYGFCVLGGVVLSWAVYPQIFESLLHGDSRGKEAFRNIMDIKNLWVRIGKLISQMETKLLYKPVLILALAAFSLIIITGIICVLRQKRQDSVLRNRISMLMAAELTFCIYMLVVAKIQPYYTNRYYFPITPLLWIVVIGNAVILFRALLTSGETTAASERIIILLITFAITAAAGTGVLKSHLDHKVMFLYPRQETILTQIQQMDRPSALFVTHESRYQLTAHCLELSHCSETLCVNLSTEADLEKYDIHDERETSVVYAAQEFDQQKLVDQILKQTAYHSCKLIGRGSGIWWEDVEEFYIYLVSK